MRFKTTSQRLYELISAHRFQQLMPIMAVVVMAIAGVALLTDSKAVSPFVAAEPEIGTFVSPATTLTDSTASGTSAVKFASGGSGATLLGWQVTAQNIGLAPFGLTCAGLPELSDDSWPGHTIPAGTTITRKRLTGWYDLSQGNITIEQSCIQPEPGAVGQGSNALTTWNSNRPLQGPIIIRDSEYDGSLLSDHDKAYTGFFQGVGSLYRNNVHHSGSGFGAYGTYEKTGSDVVIENNYVHDLIAYGDPNGSGNHQSAFTVRDFDTSVRANRQLSVRNNYFICDGANATGAFFIQPNGEDVWNMTASGNLLAGNGYQLMLEIDPGRFPGVTYHNMRAINNRFVNTEYGPTLLRGGGEGWMEWSENFMYNASAAGGKGEVVSEP